MGRKKVAAQCLEWLLVQPSVNVVGVLTDSHLSRSVTRDVAERTGVPILSLKTAHELLERKSDQVDIAFSMLYWRKLKGAFLTEIPKGIINFHPAPLPDYKGVGGYNLAILENKSDWAATAHYIDEGIDTGGILHVRAFAVNQRTETAQSLERKTQGHLFDLFQQVAQKALTTPGLLSSQPNRGGRYVSRPELEAMKLIDTENDDVERKARAFWFPPYDGAYLELQGQRFTLLPRSVLESLADPDASSLFSAASRKMEGLGKTGSSS